MRLNLLIASLVVILLGLLISGTFGSIMLGVGILLILYAFFSKESTRETDPRYIEPGYDQKPRYQQEAAHSRYLETNKSRYPQETSNPHEKSTARYVEEPKPKYKNVSKAERELKSWGSSGGKRCSSCGSTSNPANAKFCADCGKKL